MSMSKSLALMLALAPALCRAQPTTQPGLETLQAEADRVLQLSLAESRQQVGSVFAAADALARAGKLKDAIVYYRRGLARFAWSMEHQLALADALKKTGQEELARHHAGLVAQCAENDALVIRALLLLGRADQTALDLPPLAVHKAAAPKLVLVPMGECDVLLLKEAVKILQKELPLPCALQQGGVKLPPPDQEPLKELARQLRANITQNVPPDTVKNALAQMKMTVEQIKKDDEAVIRFFAALVASTQTPEDAQEFLLSAEDARAEGDKWRPATLLKALTETVQPAPGSGARYLGLTRLGLVNDDQFAHPCLLGGGKDACAVLTYRPMTALMGREIPSRKRLIGRLVKQILASAGDLYGLEACSDPRCALSATHSVPELDLKAPRPCPRCRAALVKAAGAAK